MKLRSKVFAAFFIIILVPVVLMTAFFAGFVIFQSKKIESRFGIDLMGASYQPMLLMILPAGGFLVFGTLLGIINALTNRKKGADK